MDDLRDAWEQLEREAQRGSKLDQRRIHGDRPLTLLAIFVPADRQVGIQLVVDAGSVPALGAFPSPGAFQARAERDGKFTRISVILTRGEFREVFAEMCRDLLSACLDTSGEAQAVRALHARLHTWRDLFSGSGPVPLNEAEQQGLFGELSFLLALLDAGVTANAAVASWFGPKGHHHDFHFGTTHVEIKTTDGSNHRVSISSLDQLNKGDLATLLLWQYETAASAELGTTLAGLVDKARVRVSPSGLLALNALLLNARYLDAHRPLYDAVSLGVLGEKVFVIDGAFPSLTKLNVPVAVVEARYQCDLTKVPDACRLERSLAMDQVLQRAGKIPT